MSDIRQVLLRASKWLGGLLLSAIVLTAFVNRLIDYFMGPSAYFVYLVGDFSQTNQQQLREAFERWKEGQHDLKIAGTDIRFVLLDAKEKDAEKISLKLAGRNDTLFVVGHLSTTASALALPNYLNANPPVPVILATETNPELRPPDCRLTYCPVFRLSPTDDQQAQKAAEFVVGKGALAIWVVEDAAVNSIYSHYLAQEFIRKVHQGSQGVNERPQVLAENGIQEKRQVHEKSRIQEKRQVHEKSRVLEKRQVHEKGQVLDGRQTNEQINEKKSRVLLWTTNLEVPHADVMRALGVDWVFFAGAPANCLIITRQVREIWKDPAKPPPHILLGNGCVSDELLPQAGEDMNEAFLTHPMAADDFNKEGFGSKGTQAFQLLRLLIEGADYDFGDLSRKNGAIGYYVRWLLGIHSVADARNVLRWYMERAVIMQRPFLLDKGSYTFNGDGTAKEAAFHMWKVQSTEFEEYREGAVTRANISR